MSKILIDTNVIIDIALEREPFVNDAKEIIKLIDKQQIEAYISATTVTDIYYITKRKTSHEQVINFLENLFVFVRVLPINENIVKKAMKSESKDFEDAIQIETSKQNDIGVIITRNKKDFENSGLQIFSPDEYINNLKNND